MATTPGGMFDYIEAPLNLIREPLREFQDQVETEILAAAGGGGDVVGPASAVNDRIAVFDNTTGKLIKDGGATIADIVAGSGGLVTSVFTRTGAIVAATNDYTWAQINKATSSLADIATRSATDLTSGTLPDARFPATLPALSGVNLTNLNASNLASGTVPNARLDADLTAIGNLSPTNDDIIQRKAGAWTNRTPSQFKTDLALVKADVGLGNVDNTSDLNKPISTATQTALNAKQDLLTNSAGLRGALSDETGTGLAVFNDTPNFATRLTINSASGIADYDAGAQQTGNVLKVYDTTAGADNLGWLWARRFEVGNMLTGSSTAYTPGSVPDGGGMYYSNIRSVQRVNGDPNVFDKWQNLTAWTNVESLTASHNSTQDIYGLEAGAGVIDTSNTFDLYSMFGTHSAAFVKGAGDILEALIGVIAKSQAFGSGSILKHRGSQGWASSQVGATGSSTLVQSVYGILSNLGSGYTMTEAIAGDFVIDTNAGTIGNAYVVRVRAETAGAGTVSTNRYGVYIADQNVGTVSGSVYNLYSAGSARWNHFEGKIHGDQINAASKIGIGISITTPAYPLDVQAAESLVQVKSTTGTNRAAFFVINTGGTVISGAESSTGTSLFNTGTLPYAGVFGTTGANAVQLCTNQTARVTVDSVGNVGIGTSTFGTSAQKVLALFNGTVPTTSPADMVQLFSVDLSAGNATLGLRTETAVVTESVVSDRTLTVKINGTNYKICLKS